MNVQNIVNSILSFGKVVSGAMGTITVVGTPTSIEGWIALAVAFVLVIVQKEYENQPTATPQTTATPPA